MPDTDTATKKQQQSYQPAEEPQRQLLSTLDRVFSTFRQQLRSEAPRPFTGNARIAVDTFNDILAGLRFASTPPGAFTIRAAAVQAGAIELAWTVATNVAGYRVERCEGSGCSDLEEMARLPATAQSFRDIEVSKATTYRYRVIALDARGETSSNLLEITTDSKETR